MKNTLQKMALMSLATALLFAVGITVNESIEHAAAANNTTYYHYAGREATATTFGIKEYWTDCAGYTTTTNPGGMVAQLAEPELHITETDERYIPAINMQSITEYAEATGQEVKDVIEDNCGVVLNEELTEVIEVKPGVQNITIPEGVTDIDMTGGTSPFDGNSDIKEVSIPSTFDVFDWHYVTNCSHLKEITIKANEIKYDGITQCKNLQTINISKDVQTICYGAFVGVNPNNSKLTINCEDDVDTGYFCWINGKQINNVAKGKKSKWNDQWNINASYSSIYTTNWGCSF